MVAMLSKGRFGNRRRERKNDTPAPETEPEQAVELWRDEAGLLVSGSADGVAALVARLTEAGGGQLATSPVAPTDALAAIATGLAERATSSQYVRFTPKSEKLLEKYGALPTSDGGFHSLVRGDRGIVGNLEWVPTSASPERMLAMQSVAVSLALRTAIKNVEVAVAQVQDKVDEVASLIRAERLGDVIGNRRTLDALVAHLDAGHKLTSADWDSVAALGPVITRDLEGLRAHLRALLDEVDPSWRPRERVREADELLADGLLAESLALLAVAEHNFSQWQQLRIRRIADTDPSELHAAIAFARAAMAEHLDADRQFLERFAKTQAAILDPRDHDGLAIIQNRALGRADRELSHLTRWFADLRQLDIETVSERERPAFKDSLADVIDSGRQLLPSRRPKPEIPALGEDDSTALSEADER